MAVFVALSGSIPSRNNIGTLLKVSGYVDVRGNSGVDNCNSYSAAFRNAVGLGKVKVFDMPL